MLVAEAFVLLALEPDGRRRRSRHVGRWRWGALNHWEVGVGVTGALVAELNQLGHVDLAGGRIRLTGSKPADPLLALALANVAPHDGRKLRARLQLVRHAGWRQVVDAMVADGQLGRQRDGHRPTRHPVADPDAQARLLANVQATAAGDGPLDPQTAVLLALAGPCRMLEVVAPDPADRTTAKRRIAQAGDQVPVAAAVRYVIAAHGAGA